VGLAQPLHWALSDATAEQANSSLDHGSLDGEQIERWLMAPQRVWLEEQGLRPQEWLEPIEDLEALDLAERDRQALLQERLQHLIDQLPEAEGVRGWSEPQPGHWLERSRGRGWLPPGAAAAVETDRLEQRWQRLQSALLQVGAVRRQGDRLVAGDTLVVAQPGRVRARGVLRGWWQHLQAQAAAEGRDTVMVARDTGKSGSDGFAVALRWRGFDPDQAAFYLHTLQACVLAGRRHCWPVPPESGLARALQLHKGEDAASA
jgi:Exonuclease V gamma subunit